MGGHSSWCTIVSSCSTYWCNGGMRSWGCTIDVSQALSPMLAVRQCYAMCSMYWQGPFVDCDRLQPYDFICLLDGFCHIGCTVCAPIATWWCKHHCSSRMCSLQKAAWVGVIRCALLHWDLWVVCVAENTKVVWRCNTRITWAGLA